MFCFCGGDYEAVLERLQIWWSSSVDWSMVCCSDTTMQDPDGDSLPYVVL